jgi:sugar (pentulose or hexulose) kinase
MDVLKHSNQADLVIGIDSSTTACKAIVWDCQGNLVTQGRASLALQTPRPVWHEQPAEDWWTAACQALQMVTGQVDGRRLAGLCITHQRETFVPVNEQGYPLRNAILWMDVRSGPYLAGLAEVYDRDTFHKVTGKPLNGNLTIGKIAWLRENEPEIFNQTHRYLDTHAFLVQHLTGFARTGWGCADPTGLFDIQKNTWAEELLAAVGVHADQFPQVYPPGAVLGTVTAAAALSTGLPEGLPVVAGIGDGQACGLGANITSPGDTYLNLGTAVISGTFSKDCLTSSAFRTMCGGIAGTYLLETVILGGTYTITWFIKNFSCPSFLGIATSPASLNQDGNAPSAEDALEELARQIPPGAEGLLLVPYWNSAMNPYWDASASGIVVGWRGVHQRQHLYRAILEGIAFEQRFHTLGVETELQHPVRRFIAMGGGARSDLWCQIIADVTGKPVLRTATHEAAALGAGILAAAGVGLFPGVRQAAEAMTQTQPQGFEPDIQRGLFYRQIYQEVYIHLFPALQPYLDRLSDLGTAGDGE